MARKNKIPLETAQQADGAMAPKRSVYEICGIRNVSYRAQSFAAYQNELKKMDLIELQDHAYEIGVIPAATRDMLIDRLEAKFLRENPQERKSYLNTKAEAERTAPLPNLKEQAAEIRARFR